ncbi:sodium:solute symporter family protein [Luteolibacter marinus]|uniref:sodium:solute symporter family protein n=1 Tax=Luteolibacter marinus TaxID=2776705 RepID=UPI001867CFAA|nr:sodium:solute symporter family protein [Luteolibacter marinus]
MTSLYIIIGYLALLIGLGVISNRFSKGTSADFFIVNRSVGSFLLLMSIFGTTMTGFALVGSTGKAYTSGIGTYGLMASWSGLIHSAVFFLVGIRLWAVGKRHGYLTQCEYFRNRFDSQGLGYLLFPILILLLIPYLLVGVISAGKFIQASTKGMFPEQFALNLPNGNPHPLSGGIPPELGGAIICGIVLFYVFFGGLRGAVWANTFQTLVFMITGVIAFWMISSRLGGLSAASQAVLDSEFAKPRAAREGLIGQAQFFTYCFIPLSVGMFPHLFQHWLTAKSAKSFKLTVVAHPIFIMIVWVPCILIGIWAAAHVGPLGPGQSPNSILGRMVESLVHSPVLSGLVGAGVLAAIMSSLDSQFMCLGTMFTKDIVLKKFGEDRFSDSQKVLIARGFILAIVAITYGLSVSLMNSAHVFDLGVWCFSGFAGLFPLVVGAVYWKGTTRLGAIACILVTAVTWSVLFYRDIIAVKPPGAEDELLIAGMMPVTFIVAASAISLVVVSLLTPKPADATLRKFFA